MRRGRLAALTGVLLAAVVLGRAPMATGNDYAPLEERLRRYVEGSHQDIHIFFEDLTTGAAIGIRDREPVFAGSTVKVPLVLYLYSLAAQGRVDLSASVHLLPEDFEGTDETWEPGLRPFTLRELAVSSLQVSDNVATNALLRLLGRENFYGFMRSLGALVLPTGPGEGNLTCARDAATYFKALLRLQAEVPALGQEPLSFLFETPFHDRLAAYLPWDLRVAHKVGTYENVVADAGLVLLPGRPYVLSVFVRHPWADEEDEEAAGRTIAEVSYLVYEHQRQLADRSMVR